MSLGLGQGLLVGAFVLYVIAVLHSSWRWIQYGSNVTQMSCLAIGMNGQLCSDACANCFDLNMWLDEEVLDDDFQCILGSDKPEIAHLACAKYEAVQLPGVVAGGLITVAMFLAITATSGDDIMAQLGGGFAMLGSTMLFACIEYLSYAHTDSYTTKDDAGNDVKVSPPGRLLGCKCEKKALSDEVCDCVVAGPSHYLGMVAAIMGLMGGMLVSTAPEGEDLYDVFDEGEDEYDYSAYQAPVAAAPQASYGGYGASPYASYGGYGASPYASYGGYGASPYASYGASPYASYGGYGASPYASYGGYGASPYASYGAGYGGYSPYQQYGYGY